MALTLNLKQAVDRAAAGDHAVDFDIQGKGEVVDLANCVRNLVERCRGLTPEKPVR